MFFTAAENRCSILLFVYLFGKIILKMLRITNVVIVTALCLGSLSVISTAKPARPSEVNTHCGGVLNVGADAPATINYKSGEEYGNDEQCVWTIRLADDVSRSLRFIKRESGFEARYDFLQLSSFRSTNLLLPYESRTLGNVPGQEEVTMQAHVVFVIFSSDDSNTGTGFTLDIEAVSGSRWTDVYTDFFSDSAEGNKTLKPYFNNMFSTWVITANNVDSFELGVFYDTEQLLDLVSVFHCERNGGRILFFPYGLLSGTGSWYYDLTFYTTYVVLFHSDGSVLREGLEFTWKVGKEDVTKSSLLD